MKNKYSKQKDRQLLTRFKSPYVTSRKTYWGKTWKVLVESHQALKHCLTLSSVVQSPTPDPAHQWHRTMPRPPHLNPATGQLSSHQQSKSRPLMRVPNSATGISGHPKHRTKPLPGVRVAEIFLFPRLCKRRVIPQPGTQLGTFHSVSKQTISYTHNTFQKENVINPQTKHHTARGKTPSHFPSEREGVDRTW